MVRDSRRNSARRSSVNCAPCAGCWASWHRSSARARPAWWTGQVARLAADELGEAAQLVLSSPRCSAVARRSRARIPRPSAACARCPRRSARAGLDVGGHSCRPRRRRRRAAFMCVREPVLELVVEAVLYMAGLQVEEADHERAGEAEDEVEKPSPCRRRAARRAGLSASNMATGSLPTLRLPMISPMDRWWRAGPRRCRAGRGRSRGRSGSARGQAAPRGGSARRRGWSGWRPATGGPGRDGGLESTRAIGEQHRLQAGGRAAAGAVLESSIHSTHAAAATPGAD